METLQHLDADGTLVGPEPEMSDETMVEIMEAMLTIRTLDERMMALQRQGRVGFYGQARGQEAAVASAVPLTEDDWVWPALREGGIALTRGYTIEQYLHHLFGTAEAVEKGRSMPCHYSDKQVNHVSFSSCIGNHLPQAVGAAYAADYKGRDQVMMAYLGDGATSEPDFHYAMNFGALWEAPCVFFCQNNQWSISVPFEQQTATETIAEKGVAYDVPSVRIDGNDVFAVHEAARDAVERARDGHGPTLVESVTYRRGGHSSSDDPERYRSDEELERWRGRDPIDRFRTYLSQRGLWDEEREAAFVESVESEIDEAIEAAEEAPDPPIESMFTDVHAEMPPHIEEQLELLEAEQEDG